jgi:hypothetical protein
MPAPLHEQLCPLGSATPDNAKHLRIFLGKTIDSTATTKGNQTVHYGNQTTDVLHRATLITTALLAVYNCFFLWTP